MANITNQYNPDYVSPPGETLAETLESLGMSQIELAKSMGRPIQTIHEMITGKTAITPETALLLEKIVRVPARFWNNRERLYREFLAQRMERERIAKDVKTAKKRSRKIVCT